MISVNMGGFKQHLDFFVSECSENNICDVADTFSLSKGEAIDNINDCLTAYNDLCTNMNDVYYSTMMYLQKAYHNTSSCEESNSL